MVLVFKYIVPNGFTGISLFPFVFVKHAVLKTNARFINHERIHLRQQVELLILPFFIWYAVEFVIGYMKYRSWHRAYRNISFEHEAYEHEGNLDYLSKRPFWNFMRYI